MSNPNLKPVANSALKPAAELARASGMRFPNESAEYRRAARRCWPRRSSCAATSSASPSSAARCRRAARSRRTMRSRASSGTASFADLFGDKDTLVVYNYMYGPQRERPCPMCTSLLSAWDGEVPDIQQRIGTRDRRAFADRAADRVQARTRLASSAAVFRTSRANSAATIMR